MHRTTGRRGAALTAMLALALTGCGIALPGLGGAPELDEQDVITYSRSVSGVYGDLGTRTVEVGPDTLTTRYSMPGGTELFSVEEELAAEDRERIMTATEEYIAWQDSPGDKAVCADTPSITVQVTGSHEHSSTRDDCPGDEPPGALLSALEEAQSAEVAALAVPGVEWRIDLRPWSGDGPDEDASVERYRLGHGGDGSPMSIEGERAPDGWSDDLEPAAGEDERLLDEEATAAVLRALNGVLMPDSALDCDAPTGAMTLIRDGEPTGTWELPVCAGQESETLVEELRGL